MTLRLRRKRQTTVRSTSPARARKRPANRSDVARGRRPWPTIPAETFLVALLAGLAVATWSTAAAAGDTTVWKPSVTRVDRATTAQSTAGQQGHKLQWLPYRPRVPREDFPVVGVQDPPAIEDSQVVAAQYTAPISSATPTLAPTRTAQGSAASPFDDPFGDSQPHPFGGRSFRSPTDGMPAVAQRPALTDDVIRSRKPEPAPVLDGLGIDFPDPLPISPGEASSGIGTDRDDDMEEAGRRFDQWQVQLDPPCPAPDDKGFNTPIEDLDVDITPDPPEGGADLPDLPKVCPHGQDQHVPRQWAPTTYTWKASGLCHNPLYFEDVHLERYGHSWGPYLQPIISGGHFFLSTATLPYKMGLNPPGECIYTLGYYRPGSCAPYMLDPFPLSVRAAAAQAGAVTGMAFFLP